MKTLLSILSLALAGGIVNCTVAQTNDASAVVAPGAKLEKLAGDFKFTEGPTCDKEGNLFFTDQPNDRIMKWSVDGKLSTFMQPAGRANGMFFDTQGNLIACADEKTELWSITPDGKHTVLAKEYEGKKLNGPNDVWVRADGSLFFTDPFYKRPWWTHNEPPQGTQQVYFLSADRKTLKRVTSDLAQPNGIIGTPDGKTLYVADIRARKTYAFDIQPDGSLANKRLHCELGSDGMTLDTEGNLYLTGRGVVVFDKSGKQIAHIAVPEGWTANVSFGGKPQRLRAKGLLPASRIPGGARLSAESLDKRWGLLKSPAEVRSILADAETVAAMQQFERNIENFIGTVKLPVGLAGPLRINGLFAQGDFYVPLATTEAALVASYSRGALAMSEAGGCAAMLVSEGVSRAPGFAFRNLEEAGRFVVWALAQQEAFRQAAEATTRHGRLADVRFTIEGNHVYLFLEFTTGSAAGQNMVTIATEAVCEYIREHTPVTPRYFFVEANLSGDKKASALSFMNVRGKKVVAEVTLAPALVKRFLHSTPEMMVNYWRMSALGGVMSGTIGVQGHYANGLAALFIACGQDAACVAESAVGITRFELAEDGGLYAAVTLPNIIVGTVGGGTALPSQRACLEILGLAGPDHAEALAEVCGALALAGELSIIAALSSHEFTRAHRRLARGRKEASQ